MLMATICDHTFDSLDVGRIQKGFVHLWPAAIIHEGVHSKDSPIRQHGLTALIHDPGTFGG